VKIFDRERCKNRKRDNFLNGLERVAPAATMGDMDARN
jgi:hypothetical protein